MAEATTITLNELITIADSAYSDGLVTSYHKQPKRNHGDTLAKFIAIEIRETFDPNAPSTDQILEAIRVMEQARDQLQNVIEALRKAEALLPGNQNNH